MDHEDPIQLSANEIRSRVCGYRQAGRSVFASSSFQTHSIPLLHILSTIEPAVPIAFMNTGFLFPETISFRDAIVEQFGLKLVELMSSVPKLYQLNSSGNFFFTSDPDRCCYINKIEPMQPLLIQHDVWITGVRADQSSTRKKMGLEGTADHGCIRFHPMIGWDWQAIDEYRKQHDLPGHPLETEGYYSIGCEPCTRRFDMRANGRQGRWSGMNKTECGLHLDVENTQS